MSMAIKSNYILTNITSSPHQYNNNSVSMSRLNVPYQFNKYVGRGNNITPLGDGKIIIASNCSAVADSIDRLILSKVIVIIATLQETHK